MGRRSILRKEVRTLRRDLRKADLHYTDETFRSVRRDVTTARLSLEKRLDLLNELRGNVVSREEFEAEIKGLEAKVDDTRGTRRQGSEALWGYLVGGLGVLVVGLDVILRATGH
jgi:hypothetical protein